MRRSSRIWVVALAGSLGVHLALVIHRHDPIAPAAMAEPVALDVQWIVMPAREVDPPEDLEPAASPLESPPTRPRRRVPRAASAEPSAEDTPGPAVSTTQAGTPEGTSVVAPREVDPAHLSARAVAVAAVGPRIASAEDRESAMESALTADLYRIANAAPYDTVRPPPELRATGDGGFEFTGHLFDARIAPDGTVTFSDEPNFQFGELGGPPRSLGLTFIFDISAWAEQRAGNDPHAAERRWFMDETRRTRDRLAAAARGREQGRGLVRLRRQLHETWDTHSSGGDRRRRIFRLWDGCEEDEVGAVARAAIVEFVQDHAPAGSVDAYPREELASLNRSRVSVERFAPYE